MSKAKTSKKDTLKKESEPVKVKKTDCMNVVLADLSDVQLLREISENLNNVVPTICEHVKDMDDENKYNTYNKYFNVVRYYKETLDKINRDILQLLHNKHIEETHKCDKDAANMVDNEDNVSVDADEPPPKAISKKAPAKRAASAPPVKSKVVAKKVA